MNNLPDMVLYEDREILVCRKQAGTAVQSAKLREPDMVSILKNRLPEKQNEIYVVHRLDQPVEGVLVFARRKKAAESLSRQITEGRMQKCYRAVCCAEDPGKSPDEWQAPTVLNDYLEKDETGNRSFISEKGRKRAKPAVLSFRAVDTRLFREQRRLVLTEIVLGTGRHHQIRVQMAHAGLPLAGDRKYNPGWEEWKRALSEENRVFETVSSPALCAVSLTFFHPVTGEKMTFQSEPQSPAFSIFKSV